MADLRPVGALVAEWVRCPGCAAPLRVAPGTMTACLRCRCWVRLAPAEHGPTPAEVCLPAPPAARGPWEELLARVEMTRRKGVTP